MPHRSRAEGPGRTGRTAHVGAAPGGPGHGATDAAHTPSPSRRPPAALGPRAQRTRRRLRPVAPTPQHRPGRPPPHTLAMRCVPQRRSRPRRPSHNPPERATPERGRPGRTHSLTHTHARLKAHQVIPSDLMRLTRGNRLRCPATYTRRKATERAARHCRGREFGRVAQHRREFPASRSGDTGAGRRAP